MVKVLHEAVKVEGSKIVWMKREEGTRESERCGGERCGGVFDCAQIYALHVHPSSTLYRYM